MGRRLMLLLQRRRQLLFHAHHRHHILGLLFPFVLLTMPWQSLSSLVVVMTMFNVVPLLVTGIQYAAYGVSSLFFVFTVDSGSGSIGPFLRRFRAHPVVDFPVFVSLGVRRTRAATHYLRCCFHHLFLFIQKPKELGLPANDWNYRMAKRDEVYKRMEREVRKSMNKK
jgi:hypothetical protein